MWEGDGVQVKSLKYQKLGFEVIGVILIRFDEKSVKWTVGIKGVSCNGLEEWNYK